MKIRIANTLHIVAVVLFVCIIATISGGEGFNIIGMSVSKMTTLLVCTTAVGVMLKRDNENKKSQSSKK